MDSIGDWGGGALGLNGSGLESAKSTLLAEPLF